MAELIPGFPHDGVVTINYDMLWSGKGYSEEEAKAAKKAKELYG
jgi:hypothetical protein